jgi:hypothetical protein
VLAARPPSKSIHVAGRQHEAPGLMDFSKLSSNEKLATYGAVATIVGGVVAAGAYPGHWGISWIGVIAGLAMLVVVFLPQMSAGTSLPGSKGSLMLIAGGVGAVIMALAFLSTIAFTFTDFDLSSVLFLVAVAGALVMGWAAWQAFQSEGGKFTVGMAGTGAGTTTPAAPSAPSAQATPATPSAPSAPMAEPMRTDEPMSPPAGNPPSMGGNEDDQR